MTVLASYAPDIEIYSHDEVFLAFTGSWRMNLEAYARTIRDEVKRRTGIPVSIGLAGTKTLAKVANKLAKSTPEFDGVFDLEQHQDKDRFLKTFQIKDLWQEFQELFACPAISCTISRC
jgi:DNA polymerase V